MANDQDVISIHPSIITSVNKGESQERIPVCCELVKDVDNKWESRAANDGSLQDLQIILRDLIAGANESVGKQYKFGLADDYGSHIWDSFEAFERDNRRKNYNKVAVLCCPLSYIKEYNQPRPRGKNYVKLIYQVKDQQLEEYDELKQFYKAIYSTQKRDEEQIIVYAELQYLAETWLAMVDELHIHRAQDVTYGSYQSRRRTY